MLSIVPIYIHVYKLFIAHCSCAYVHTKDWAWFQYKLRRGCNTVHVIICVATQTSCGRHPSNRLAVVGLSTHNQISNNHKLKPLEFVVRMFVCSDLSLHGVATPPIYHVASPGPIRSTPHSNYLMWFVLELWWSLYQQLPTHKPHSEAFLASQWKSAARRHIV